MKLPKRTASTIIDLGEFSQTNCAAGRGQREEEFKETTPEPNAWRGARLRLVVCDQISTGESGPPDVAYRSLGD